MIVWMLAMPADTRLLSPLIEPFEKLGGAAWGTGKATPAFQQNLSRHSRSKP